MSKQKSVLPADVYDALELSALVHGGIGSGCLSKKEDPNDWDNDTEVPSCIIGHALFLDGYNFWERDVVPNKSPVCDALVKAFPALEDEIGYSILGEKDAYHALIDEIENLNDRTVSQYAKRNDPFVEPTLTWKQWTKRMGVVRGE